MLPPLTLRMRNTLRAAATDAMILRELPGCPAAMNMQAYCVQGASSIKSASRRGH